ncbi:MAG: DUF5680 domain-containing protein [archaeon]|jgi:hypothetical protein
MSKSIVRITTFLAKARQLAGYENKGETKLEKKFTDGSRQLGPYVEEDLTYLDNWKGHEQFKGREVILEKEKPIWERVYAGGIIELNLDKKEIEEVFFVLRLAMQNFPEMRPEKRGMNLKKNEIEYREKVIGGIEKFKGEEMIFKNKIKVYELKHEGGFI